MAHEFLSVVPETSTLGDTATISLLRRHEGNARSTKAPAMSSGCASVSVTLAGANGIGAIPEMGDYIYDQPMGYREMDTEQAARALKGIPGKRLTYQRRIA